MPTAGQQIVVLCQWVNSAPAFTYGTPEGQKAVGRIFQMHSRSEESAVDAAVVPPQTTHHNEPLSQLVGILGVEARGGFGRKFA